MSISNNSWSFGFAKIVIVYCRYLVASCRPRC